MDKVAAWNVCELFFISNGDWPVSFKFSSRAAVFSNWYAVNQFKVVKRSKNKWKLNEFQIYTIFTTTTKITHFPVSWPAPLSSTWIYSSISSQCLPGMQRCLMANSPQRTRVPTSEYSTANSRPAALKLDSPPRKCNSHRCRSSNRPIEPPSDTHVHRMLPCNPVSHPGLPMNRSA